jgi:inhibitor of KinA
VTRGPEFELRPAGDSALLLAAPERIDAAVNAWCVTVARNVREALGAAARDVVVGYCTVTVYFDPLASEPSWLEEQVRHIARRVESAPVSAGTTVDVPVCYGAEFGPDLADVAAFGRCSIDEVATLHAAATYRVFLVGFVPGFAYMATVDRRIAAGRRSAPRTAVPPGSVAIAGGQTGIYPSATPGGWNIIGRTPVKPYDPGRDDPFLFRPGDEVRFRPIGAAEFERLAQ